ncbi:putative ABC transporter ATP-binding protein YdiF [Paenibacillus montaniterrae]|uniref:ABC transporter ATP-binding protein YdiF n=1 Tax=Paenibacillus montaniterrae TaxID=429341 RepID=A0A919YQ89_9BACL|nr:ABC-F family ATP-binding cassette domain-containing protein [Paenibacillus montaniterrae]GIP16336.1 putative ABC transporter ATP-binding protein YdiF [Paenibacillus montaniterrae]
MLLQVSNITKSYGVDPILSNINLQILERDKIGLVGVNGAGKSTLLKIIAGEISYDSGEIHKAKETRIGYLAQNSGLQSDRTIIEEMLLVFADLLAVEQELRELELKIADPELHNDEKRYQDILDRYANRSDWYKNNGGFEINTRINSVLHGMGFGEFDHHTPISSLSGGQKTRLALAKILLQAPDLLMLDEPTNHLDIDTLTWLEGYLRAYSGAILVVSHDRYFLDAMTTTTIEIERHQAKKYTGNYSRYLELKAAEYEIQLKHYEKQQDEIARMEQFIQKNIVRASTTKRAQSRRKALEKMERMDRPLGDLKKASFSFEIERMSGKEVLHIHNLAVQFSESSSPLFQNVSLHLQRGEMVALVGPNGIGKSTLLKAIVGQLQPAAGTIDFGSHVKLGYYDQEHNVLNPSNTVLEEVWNAYPHMEEVRIRTVLGNFLFSGEDVLKKVSALSGGEKARVSLSKLMLAQANLLILDEPTNHLDLFSREVLEAALIDYEGTVLFISHDRYFLNKMAERIVELTPAGANYFLGNYDDMLEKKLEMEEARQEAARTAEAAKNKQLQEATNSPVQSYEVEKQQKRAERNKQRKLEAIEAEIAQLETSIAEWEEKLAEPAVFNDYIRIQEIQAEIAQLKQSLEANYEQWEELMN